MAAQMRRVFRPVVLGAVILLRRASVAEVADAALFLAALRTPALAIVR